MKSTVVLVIALATLLPHSANATTLTITSGRIVRSFDLGAQESFLGNGFQVFASEEPGCCQGLANAFGAAPFVHSMIFISSPGSSAFVTVGSQTCRGSINPFVSCGDLMLTSPGFAMPPDWPITTPFVATVPFTATGQLLVGGEQFDLVGMGTVTGTRCLAAPQAPCGSITFERIRLEYNFTFIVSEPPTLLLMLVSAIAIGMGYVHRPVVNACFHGLAALRHTRE